MNTPEYVVTFIIAVLFAILIGSINKISLSPKLTTIFRKIWVTTISTLIILFCLSFYDIYLRGYWTTKVIIWIFILLSSLLFGFGDRKYINKFIRFTAAVFTIIPISLALIFIVFGIGGKIITYKIFERIGGSSSFIFYDDKELRVERDNRGYKNQRTPKLFKKIGIFEVDKGNLRGCTHRPDSIRITKSNDSITLFCYDGAYESNPFMTNPNITKIKR